MFFIHQGHTQTKFNRIGGGLGAKAAAYIDFDLLDDIVPMFLYWSSLKSSLHHQWTIPIVSFFADIAVSYFSDCAQPPQIIRNKLDAIILL